MTSSIDRVAPTRRPEGKSAGSQNWRELLFVHWAVPVERLRPLIPEALELDLHEGVAWVGAVPFVMEDVRPWWLPGAMAFNFLETNLRAYVVHKGEPGVFFFSLEAASWLAVRAARTGWGLPYHHAAMRLTHEDGVAHYRTERRGAPSALLDVRYKLGEVLGPSAPGTLEHFLLERYLLFVERGGRILRGQIHHTPYPAQRAEVISISEGLFEAAGLPSTQGPPALVHYASGVDVEVFALR